MDKVTYLTTHDAITKIDACERGGVIVLGVDVFTISPGATRPHMDVTLDLSGMRDVAQAAAEARAHIQKFAALDYRYEIVTDV